MVYNGGEIKGSSLHDLCNYRRQYGILPANVLKSKTFIAFCGRSLFYFVKSYSGKRKGEKKMDLLIENLMFLDWRMLVMWIIGGLIALAVCFVLWIAMNQ